MMPLKKIGYFAVCALAVILYSFWPSFAAATSKQISAPKRLSPSDPRYIKYSKDVRDKIIKRWLPGMECEEAVVRVKFKIDKAGNISDPTVVQVKGNYSCVDAALQAVRKASPLPAPPEPMMWEAINEGFIVEFDNRKANSSERKGPIVITFKAPGESEDVYEDFEFNGHKYINVLRYQGEQYFVAMKRKFKTKFDPVRVLEGSPEIIRSANGKIDVVVGVVLGKSGEIMEVSILKSSGFLAYDNEAIRAVQASAPFPAPPSKLIEENFAILMVWTFSVYL